jgi:membrane associated rhomboid family serine protease
VRPRLGRSEPGGGVRLRPVERLVAEQRRGDPVQAAAVLGASISGRGSDERRGGSALAALSRTLAPMLPLSDGLPARRFPVVTVALIGANLAVWILYELPDLEGAVAQASFYPCDVENTCHPDQPWAISWLTAMFMHASWDHLLGNMLFLAIFGKNVEEAFGRLRYVAFYVAGGFAATALQTVMTLGFSPDADARIPMLGASGAISAVLGAFLALYPHARIKTLVLVFIVQIPAWIYLGGWFLYQLVEAHGALVAPSAEGSGVAFFAHIGGFVFGWVVARALVDTERRRIESDARRSALIPS